MYFVENTLNTRLWLYPDFVLSLCMKFMVGELKGKRNKITSENAQKHLVFTSFDN